MVVADHSNAIKCILLIPWHAKMKYFYKAPTGHAITLISTFAESKQYNKFEFKTSEDNIRSHSNDLLVQTLPGKINNL